MVVYAQEELNPVRLISAVELGAAPAGWRE